MPQPTVRSAGVFIYENNTIDKVFAEVKIDRKIFYFGRLIKHPETIEKSEELIEDQRALKTHLEKQGHDTYY